MWPHMGVGEWGWLCDPVPRSRGSQVHGHTGHTWLHTHTHAWSHADTPALPATVQQSHIPSHVHTCPHPHACCLSRSLSLIAPPKSCARRTHPVAHTLKSRTATKSHRHIAKVHTHRCSRAGLHHLLGEPVRVLHPDTTKFNSSLHRRENWLYHPVGMGHALGSETSSQWALWPGLGHPWAVPGARLPLKAPG